MKYLNLFLILYTLTGCSSELKVTVDTNKEICILDHTKYWSTSLNDDIITSGCEMIHPNSDEMHQLRSWFEANSDGWKEIHGTFQPEYTFKIDKYNFNITNNRIIVNYHDVNNKKIQKWHSISDTSFVYE
jgi:hypothetical protein